MTFSAAGPLTLVLTRRCDLRCGYCPQDFAERDMSEEILDAALARFAPDLSEGAALKLFGGEPLLTPALVRRAVSRMSRLRPDRAIELPTNGAALDDEMADFLNRHPQVRVALSRPTAVARRLNNLVVNFLLPPGEPAAAALRRLAGWIRFGAARFNFLPAYYVPWSEPQIRELARSLSGARALLARTRGIGEDAAAVNSTRRGPAPLYNGGVAVDVNGEVYAGNFFLAAAAAPRRKKMLLGRVGQRAPLKAAPSSTELADLADASFPAEVMRATRAVDRVLSDVFARASPAERR